MKQRTNTTKYFAYVRKSTEGEERQALSISSQIDKVKELFGDVDIVEILEKKHSAFSPYERPVFENMIKRIRKGEATGVIAWHPDRLSRNEIDASTITYLVRTGVIHDLKFGSYNFDNSPEGIMMLQMALSQSQYFSSKLGKDVRRGLEKKYEMGWQPNMCPNGYVNVRHAGLSTIEVDEKRFKIVRKAFDLMLSGTYSVPEVLDKLNNEWKFDPKTNSRNKSGKLVRASLYRMFTNIFYAGIIEYNGQQKQGKHKAMITLEEYDRIQMLLGRNDKPRYSKHEFAFTGIIRCGECGCLITGEEHTKIIKATKKHATYTYYRCTHKKVAQNCTQSPITSIDLEKQIDIELRRYEFHPEFKKLFFQIAEDDKKDNPEQNKNVVVEYEKSIEKVKLEKINLTKLSCRGLVCDEEYVAQKNEYEKELVNLSQKLEKIKKDNNQKDELLDKIDYAMRARTRFNKEDAKGKKTVLLKIGLNRELKDKKLFVTPYKWLSYTTEKLKPLEDKFTRFELDKLPLTKAKSERLNSLRCELRCTRVKYPVNTISIRVFERFVQRRFEACGSGSI